MTPRWSILAGIFSPAFALKNCPARRIQGIERAGRLASNALFPAKQNAAAISLTTCGRKPLTVSAQTRIVTFFGE
jgi:hypothetical protein